MLRKESVSYDVKKVSLLNPLTKMDMLNNRCMKSCYYGQSCITMLLSLWLNWIIMSFW